MKDFYALTHKAVRKPRRFILLSYSIGEAEYRLRVERIRKALSKRRIDALYLTNGTSMFYLTGYSFISTERPAALIVPKDGKITFIGPLLEKDHVPLETRIIEDVKTYMDYPGEKHPIEIFAEFLKEMKLANRRIGMDSKTGVAGMWGYKGEPLAKKLPEAKFVDVSDIVPSMRLLKSDNEINLMKESAKWANLAMALLQEYTEEGLWDVNVALAAMHATSVIMKKTLGHDYEPKRGNPAVPPVSAMFRGQIGEMSAIPHSVATKRIIKKGDVLIGEVGVDVGGYSCELERTMILGKPSQKQERYFNVMLNAQKAGFDALKLGAKCSEVDQATFNVFRKARLAHLVRHHTGHGLGLEAHELPWLDIGNGEPLRSGMIVSCEPGIYEVGFAGFRHSDSVLMTDDGTELLTYYPRNLEELIIE
jgi:Xaa-Pro dipeptidase